MSLLENPLLKKVEENGGPFGRGQGPRGEQNFVPFFQKGDNYLMYENTYKSIYSNNYNAQQYNCYWRNRIYRQ